MRFMMLIHSDPASEAGQMPNPEQIAAMMKYNEELTKAGVLLALDGLHPTSKGARITWTGGKPQVVDGPFAEAKEVVGGYWMIQVKSRDEALAWATRIPAEAPTTVELRQVFEMADFEIPADSAIHQQVERVEAGLRQAGS